MKHVPNELHVDLLNPHLANYLTFRSYSGLMNVDPKWLNNKALEP